MSSKELREAADRELQVVAEACQQWACVEARSVSQHLADAEALARAYLAENDPTPISPEWCASVFGPPDTDSCHVIPLAEGGVITVYPHLTNVDICDRENNTLWDMDKPSRGALLKLFSALGVPTKE